MTSRLKNFYYRLTPTPSSTTVPTVSFSKAPSAPDLFPATNPSSDGDECLHDCSSCSVKYPSNFTIDENEELYGHVKGWATHLIVATGKSDWVRNVADEKGSIMEAVDKSDVKPSNGKLMLSASNMPIPEHEADTTSVLLLPAFAFIDNVTPSNVPSLIADYVSKGPVNTTPLLQSASPTPPAATTTETDEEASSQPGPVSGPILKSRACPHQYLILLCSQKTRDARCGQSAPLLRREFERHLRPLGLHRDLHDERPGGVGIYFISHVGGHKFSANVMIYRKDGTSGSTIDQSRPKETTESSLEGSEVSNIGQAAQCIWLARVRPEDCENIVRYTVLQGKVVKPERQLRGGFDRSKRLVSW